MRSFLLMIALCGSVAASAQGFIMHFDAQQNGRAGNGHSVREVADGYLVFCSQYAQALPVRDHVFIRKISHTGEFLHETEYGDHPTAQYEMGYIDPMTRDAQGLHVGAFHEGWNYGDTVYLARYDDAGVMVDQHFLYAYPAVDSVIAYIRQVRGTSDGGFVLGGVWGIPGTTNAMAFVVRTDASGDTLWTAHYGVDLPVQGYHYCLGVEEYSDGGVLIVGYRSVGLDRDFLIRTNSEGHELWRRYFGYIAGGNTAVRVAADGNVYTWSTYKDEPGPLPIQELMLTKWSASGNILWQRRSNRGYLTLTDDMEVLADGSIITSGELDVFAFLAKYNSAGDSLWARKYRLRSNQHWFYDVEPTSDGGFIATGVSKRYSWDTIAVNTNQLIWVVKTDSLGCVVPGCHTVGVQEYLLDLNEHLRVWPNPVGRGQPLTLSFTPPPEFVPQGRLRVVLLDAAGRTVHTEGLLPSMAGPVGLHPPSLAPGVYHLHLVDDTRWLAGSSVVVE